MIKDKQNESPLEENRLNGDKIVSYGSENTNTPPFLNKKQEPKENFFFELFKIILFAIVIVVPIRVFIAQPFIVSGASMEDTFKNGQYLIVDQLGYRFKEPDRGDVIIFRFPADPSKFFIKRIIGLPNETVILQGKSTIIINDKHIDGIVIEEEYLSPDNVDPYYFSTILGDGEYFVMGDNRKESSDSRSWGVLKKDLIIGQAFIRLFPINKFDILPGKN